MKDIMRDELEAPKIVDRSTFRSSPVEGSKAYSVRFSKGLRTIFGPPNGSKMRCSPRSPGRRWGNTFGRTERRGTAGA